MKKEKDKKKTFRSTEEAYFRAGKKAGLIEGYKRANDNIKSTLDRLEKLFIDNVNGAFDEAKSELIENS